MLARRWNKSVLVGLQACIRAVEISSKKQKVIYFKIQLYHSWACTLKNVSSYHRATFSHVSVAALFIIVRNWKQPRCPSTDEWIKKHGTFTQQNITLSFKNK